MTCAIPCECSEHLVFKARIEGRNFLRCSACNSLTPMPQRGARLLNEVQFVESLKQYESERKRANDRNWCWKLLGVVSIALPWVIGIYVGCHLYAWWGRA